MTASRASALPSVDVVVPLYEKAAVVGRAIRSVQSQTHTGWRLTIVDDGSTDDVDAALAPFRGDERIRIVRQDNAGPGAARNCGLALADADLIAFLDADDEWHPRFLEEQTSILEASAHLAAVTSSWEHDIGRLDAHALLVQRGLTGEWRWDTSCTFEELRTRLNFFHTSAVVARREVVVELGGFWAADRCLYGEDTWLWLGVLLTRPVHFREEMLLIFHTDASSLSTGRDSPYPLPPVLTRGGQFVSTLPAVLRPWAKQYLLWYAGFVARRSVRERVFSQALSVGWVARRQLQAPWPVAGGIPVTAFLEVARGRLVRLAGRDDRAR